eukprot:TRINITY_DN8717_c0_g1_i1.p1 TRINITY_DN8717_c0_g1~~TRINITY_DN8717_c0_g1_i1.p1  ORF type:complete len:310 (-),score=49.52 TRINITY_DN8717_c0_g1_i1:222-1151(-)
MEEWNSDVDYDVGFEGGFGEKMAADSNMGFHHGGIPASFFNRHAISFHPGALNGAAGMISPVNSVVMNNKTGIVPGGNRSSGGLILDQMPGLKHDTGLAAEWSREEQSILDEGLLIYAAESTIMRYIKIAATLREKTVRDVALRCRWMTKEHGKRRKSEENYIGKKIKDRKEKLTDSSPKTNITPAPQSNMNAYSFLIHHMGHNDRISCEVGGTIRHLLGENAQIFSQITANLTTFKVQDNIDLFCRMRNNITAILNNMRDMPGIMSQMPPLPVSIDEELANSILLSPTTHALMFGLPNGFHLKQEPRF